jgi:hypothetical protein
MSFLNGKIIIQVILVFVKGYKENQDVGRKYFSIKLLQKKQSHKSKALSDFRNQSLRPLTLVVW